MTRVHTERTQTNRQTKYGHDNTSYTASNLWRKNVSTIIILIDSVYKVHCNNSECKGQSGGTRDVCHEINVHEYDERVEQKNRSVRDWVPALSLSTRPVWAN